jgi:hypothetical protein
MKRSDAFPSRYLSKDDVKRAVDPIRATIKDVLIETLGQGSDAEDKPVLHFRGSNLKPMVLNAGNWGIVEEAYGEDTETWTGKPVDIYYNPDVMFGKERTGGIRLRIPGRPHAVPAGATPPSRPETPPETDLLTLEDAIAAAEKAGIAKDKFLESLRVFCPNGYKSSRDTAAARKIIQDAIDEANTIPF